MEVIPFSEQPNSRLRNVTECMIKHDREKFNLSLDPAKINTPGSRKVLLSRGQSSWHSAWNIHKSSPNKSSCRRLAWIVRYVPTGTTVKGGVRDAFGADYQIVPVAGAGSSSKLAQPHRERYAPCLGKNTALKK